VKVSYSKGVATHTDSESCVRSGRKTTIEKLITTAVTHRASDFGSLHVDRLAVSLFGQRLALMRILQSLMLIDPIARDARARYRTKCQPDTDSTRRLVRNRRLPQSQFGHSLLLLSRGTSPRESELAD
jgi:hypothetical protein